MADQQEAPLEAGALVCSLKPSPAVWRTLLIAVHAVRELDKGGVESEPARLGHPLGHRGRSAQRRSSGADAEGQPLPARRDVDPHE